MGAHNIGSFSLLLVVGFDLFFQFFVKALKGSYYKGKHLYWEEDKNFRFFKMLETGFFFFWVLYEKLKFVTYAIFSFL